MIMRISVRLTGLNWLVVWLIWGQDIEAFQSHVKCMVMDTQDNVPLINEFGSHCECWNYSSSVWVYGRGCSSGNSHPSRKLRLQKLTNYLLKESRRKEKAH
jgi:hypothetical protein